jgi:diaminopimelate epimerase
MSFFYKMTGAGNDFIVLDGYQERSEDWPSTRIRAACDRRLGVGADGLLLIKWEQSGQVLMKYFNSDGSPAPICGNALLCTARLTALLRRDHDGQVNIKTEAGTFWAKATLSKEQVRLMWPAKVSVQEVTSIKREPGEKQMFLGDVGVPHLCVFVQDVQTVDVQKRGQALRFHPILKASGANVNFVEDGCGKVRSFRTYERGIEAETYACITGALVCAAALIQAGQCEVPISLRVRSGGMIMIEGRMIEEGLEDCRIFGEARLVFTGVLTAS